MADQLDPSTPHPLDRLAAPPVFIVGHHRSGTTWAFDLLTYPDDVAGVFESWLFSQEYGLGGLLHWGHWEPDHVRRVEKIFGRRPGIGQLVSHEETIAVSRAIARDWLGRACSPGTRFLVEKSPDHLYAVLAISEVFPDARFVNVIRDGRDVAVSSRAAQSWDQGMQSTPTSASERARRWRHSVEFSRKIAPMLGSRYIEVTYEDLKADPHASLATLYAFCGFDVDDAQIDAAIKASAFEPKEGGQDRFRRAGRVGDWRTSLTMLDKFRFQVAVGNALIDRGYESSRWWWLRPARRS